MTAPRVFLVGFNQLMEPFPEWGANEALSALALNTGPWVKGNRSYLEGDHWQSGAGWIGPQPSNNEAGFTETMRKIELAFTSRNVIAEIVDRHKNGVCGREPRWRFTPIRFLAPGENPNEAELKDIAELEGMVTNWWNCRKAISVLQVAARNALFAARGPVRLYIPRGLLVQVKTDEGGVVAGVVVDRGDIESALDLIWPEAPDPESATAYIDPLTRREVGIVIETDLAGVDTFNLTFLDQSGDDPELTVHRTITRGAEAKEADFQFNFGGRITVNEVRRERLINDQILQGQRALNLALSMIPRTVITAGFLERVLLNAQMPGEFQDIKDATGKVTGKRFVPGTPVFGAGTTNYVAPLAVEEDDGKGGTRTVMTNADVKWREPVDPLAAINAKTAHYQDILEEANQAHILITSDATPSGNSREQARAEYEASLNETKPHVDHVGRWMLETLVAMAEELAGVPGKFTSKYRVVYESNVDTGPLTADEKRQNYESADKGYLSAQGAMELNGVEDVDAEMARIKSEGAGNLGSMIQRATALKLLTDAQFPMAVAMKVLGFPEEFHAEIISEMEKQKKAEQDQAVELAKAAPPKPAGPTGAAPKKAPAK